MTLMATTLHPAPARPGADLMGETSRLMDRVRGVWCEWFHDAPMWPIHGQYECATCGRHKSVPWA